jgi:hypothetical protein
MRGRIRGGLLALVSLTVLIAGMVLIDNRLGYQVARIVRGEGLSDDVLSQANRVERVVLVSIDALRYQSAEHALLTAFAIGACMLLIFMFRVRI